MSVTRSPNCVDIRQHGAKCNGTTDDSAALASACAALPSTGGIVEVPTGVMAIGSTLTIGDGVGGTQSTRQNVLIQGQGSSSGNASHVGASTIKWIGGASTMIRVQGPIHGVRLHNLVIDGGGTATVLYDEMASGNGGLENVAFRNVAPGGLVHRMDAVNDFNGNCSGNVYTNVFANAIASGASGLVVGATSLNANAGVFQNTFINYICAYANDTAGSVGVTLAWCDNNVFLNCSIKPVAVPGSGIAVKHVRQSGVWNFLPSENTFIHTPVGDPGGAVGFSGDSGRGIGTICWPYQVFDSSGIPPIKNLRGWLGNGDFFDTSGKMGFQKLLTLYAHADLAQMQILGFARALGTGTITTTGTAVLGSGTNFTGQLAVGKMLANGNDFRRVVSIADNTHCTLASAFTDDVPAGTGFEYQLGASGFIFGDGALNIGTYDASELMLYTNGNVRFKLTAAGVPIFDGLPSSAPAKGAWYDPADSNRIKYVP